MARLTPLQRYLSRLEIARRRGELALHDDDDRLLIARAIQETRVSKFTRTERARLSMLLVYIGYKIEGGL